MALPNIQPSDFTGYLAIAYNQYTEGALTDYISRFSAVWLRRFVGDATYAAIRDESPQPQKFTDLLGGVEYVGETGKLTNMRGITSLLKECIYAEYVRNQRYKNTLTGIEVGQAENSQPNMAANGYIQASRRIGDAIAAYNAEVLPFLLYYASVSREIEASTDLGGGSYQLQASDLQYLSAGDYVCIDGISFAVSSIDSAVLFTISGAEAGQDFTGRAAVWKPFGDAAACSLAYSFF